MSLLERIEVTFGQRLENGGFVSWPMLNIEDTLGNNSLHSAFGRSQTVFALNTSH